MLLAGPPSDIRCSFMEPFFGKMSKAIMKNKTKITTQRNTQPTFPNRLLIITDQCCNVFARLLDTCTLNIHYGDTPRWAGLSQLSLGLLSCRNHCNSNFRWALSSCHNHCNSNSHWALTPKNHDWSQPISAKLTYLGKANLWRTCVPKGVELPREPRHFEHVDFGKTPSPQSSIIGPR